MAYSRWSNSDWYIFWHTDSGKTKEEQVLAVWLAQGKHLYFTYEELTDQDFSIEKHFPDAPDYNDAKESI